VQVKKLKLVFAVSSRLVDSNMRYHKNPNFYFEFLTWAIIQSGRLLGAGRLIILNEQLVKIKEKFSTMELKHRKKDFKGKFQFIPFSLLLSFFKSNRNDTWGVFYNLFLRVIILFFRLV